MRGAGALKRQELDEKVLWGKIIIVCAFRPGLIAAAAPAFFSAHLAFRFASMGNEVVVPG